MNNYNGWLTSTNIFKRSVAVFWHNMLWYIIVMATILIPLLILWWIIEAL